MTSTSKNYKGIQVRGQVVELPVLRDGVKDGKMWMQAKWKVRESKTEKIWSCIGWNEVAKSFTSQVVSLEQRIIIEGNTDSEFEVTVRGFFIPDKAKTWREVLVKAYGGEAGLTDARERFETYMKAQGKVKTVQDRSGEKVVVYLPKADTVEWDGNCYSKIEFCMDILGAETVNKRIREKFPKLSDAMVPGMREQYRGLVEALCEEAVKYVGANVHKGGYEYDENE